MVPTIETARLRLRDIREQDLGAHAAMLGDPEVVRFVGGTPLAREEAWRRMLTGLAMWPLFGFGFWAVEAKESGDYVGLAGFADFKREVTPSLDGTVEAGWLFARRAHGKGYATEAMLAAFRWADEHVQAPEFTAIISHGNAGSIRVAEKLGYDRREEALYRGEPLLLFRRARRSA